MTPRDQDPWGNKRATEDNRPWSKPSRRNGGGIQLPSFHWSLIDPETVIRSTVAIALLGLALLGVNALLPNGDDCRGTECQGIAPIALYATTGGEGVAIEYLPCGTEYVQSITLADAASGDVLWTIQTNRATTREVFALGASAPAPYQEIVPFQDDLTGRYTVSILADRSHETVFHTRDIPADGVLYQGIPMEADEWQARARTFGDCPFWNDVAGTGRAPWLALGLGLIAAAMAAGWAATSIKQRP